MSQSPRSGPEIGRPWQNPEHYRAWPHGTGKEAEVFGGLVARDTTLPATCAGESPTVKNVILGGLPLLMTGTLTAGVAVTSAFPPPEPTPTEHQAAGHRVSLGDLVAEVSERLSNALHPVSHHVVSAIAPHIPDTYTVQAGDTVSSIASAYGLPASAILGLNGLTMNSLLHEGQILKLTTAPTKQRAEAPPRVALSQYVVQAGDTLSSIASRFGISQSALTETNRIDNTTTLMAGDVIRLPGTRTPTAPRAIPTLYQAQSEARVVWASAGLSPAAPTAEGIQPTSVPDLPEESAEEDSPPTEPPAPDVVDPLDTEISEAPALRVVKKAPPPPPPPPVQERAPERAPTAPSSGSSNPAPAPSPAPAPAPRPPVSGTVVKLPHESQREHARTIIRVGRDLGVPDYGIVIALATAMQESSFRNIQTALDHDSLGLFQQRPYWWGTPEQLVDPVYATTVFFTGVRMPDVGFSRGLLGVSGWQDLPLTVAAQRVQRSAHPDAYAKWEASAWAWLAELG